MATFQNHFNQNYRNHFQESYFEDEEGLQRRHKVDTTLQVHFFGKKGNQDLHYEGFYKFMDNLQTEVLELEFYEFSKGNIAITEVDFAKILLRYTYLVGFYDALTRFEFGLIELHCELVVYLLL